ncbi:Type-1 restriction enzyme R protein [Kingella potus]|uniref:Type-1 restriction enzyme R protein n=1 Tax=Kingella potus TaxID=265175 RepID=A0A377R1Y0_9NEIS|nr:DEAD/DEAH box helicase family protein [Kingella potus]UOP00426.1 DEAD/DEAH box helicase family protein [Kingella potus]STR02506.1 Type-1 restriction enzyme R protein [Kingella potus]
MHREIDFENAVEAALLAGGYRQLDPKGYDKSTALFPQEVLAFVQASQPELWQRVVQIHGDRAADVLLDSLQKELANKGALAVLRGGFKCVGKTLRLAFFAPNSALNPEAAARYALNRLSVCRQLQTQSGAIPDVVLVLNGLPIATMELKNPLTGQTVADAVAQYRSRKVQGEPLFAFKQRALVHFAVDTEAVMMATRLAGADTFFLPFNKGFDFGAGNPPADHGVRTAYLWQEVLARDSLMDIVHRFMHLQTEERTVQTKSGVKRVVKETMIFPRYHQLDAVRSLVAHAKAHGSGHNYLIQHSAGSGKSNSIAWLAHRLANLHDDRQEKIFHSVIVITDRRVLDRQLQDTVYQFEHKSGVVEKIDKDTQQLSQALAGGTPIIISTIQKFPFISQALQTLQKQGRQVEIDTRGKRFAVIVDEAHSSQSGETAMELRKILNGDGIAAAVAAQFLDGEGDADLSDDAQKALLTEQLKRGRQENLSFFAFTATPKHKTLFLFDEAGKDGKAPFHHYSMRQAIEEGFIHDVLAHYTCYKRYYKLVQQGSEDPDLPRRKAAKALARFVSFHDYEIRQKVEVIVEHFRTHSRHKIGGRAKAMIVTNSREHAVRYKLGLDKYLQEKGYSDIKSLVAFSGEITLKEYGDQRFTETGMNGGIKESELPQAFDDNDDYRLLLVAEKYQTGFDQPLLHSMYVDKRLSGIAAVQTLSRLNRTAAGKSDTFVLDFVNEEDEIYAAFKPYYEYTPAEDAPDPQQLNNLAHALKEKRLLDQEEINAWCEIWFAAREPSGAAHQKMNALLDKAVLRFTDLAEEEQEHAKGQMVSFRNLYAFLAQILPYQDSEWEKLYSYLRFLLPKLPHGSDTRRVQIDDDVALEYYRLEKISDGSIGLKEGEAQPLRGATAVGTGKPDEEVPLSSLVEKLNERFGTAFTQADQLFFDQIRETAAGNEQLVQAAQANNESNFAAVFKRQLEGLFIERMEGNEEIFTRLMDDQAFHRMAADYLAGEVYRRIRSDAGL